MTEDKTKYDQRANMKSLFIIATFMLIVAGMAAQGQGTITFNCAAYFDGTNYSELGMQFRVITPTSGDHDYMGISPAITSPWNTPYNSTPYMYFIRQNSPDDYVGFSLTNGYIFGLTSVQLADAASPSLSSVPILFVGFLSSGSTVTNIFTTPGNGATTFQNYLFTPAFAGGLTSVDILAPRWAMDNLVFGNVVPEPGMGSLVVIGLLAFASLKTKIRS